MTELYIAHFKSISFNSNADTMTKSYYDKGSSYEKSVNGMPFESRLGNFELAVGTYDEVQTIVAKQISHYLNCNGLKPSDFCFVFTFQDIKDGTAWFPQRNSGLIQLT